MATAVDARRDVEAASEAVSRPRLPGLFLGIGLGGFVDGIVLHQILQWHHMLTSEGDYPKTTVSGLETNTLWDGLFHAATWIAVAIGVWVLWEAHHGLATGYQRQGLFRVVAGRLGPVQRR
jgi:uncharacterized membrane protein